jgi:ribosomal protein S18 acetylase RimI-like enzyme
MGERSDATSWRVREAAAPDSDRLALIGAATFLETFAGLLDGLAIVEHCRKEHCSAAYRRQLRAGGKAWLAETSAGEAPIGFALLGAASLPGTSPDGSDLELKRIYTLSRFHGLGLGAALMDAAIAEARRRDARRLLLGVYAGNERAIAFYRKQGFAPIANRLFRVGGRDYDDVVFAKPLP